MRIQSRFGMALSACAAAATAIASPAWGQTSNSGTFKTGEELYEVCTSSEDADLEVCDWYIMGVHDAVILHQDLEWVERTICIAEGTTAGELREKVVAYLNNSDDRDFSAVSMVYNALEAEYPC